MKSTAPLSLALVLFLISLFARLTLIDQSLFYDDEALHFKVATEIADGTYFPRLGPKLSVPGAHSPGPFYFYALAGTQIFGSNPLLANALIALLGSLAVLLLWDSIRRIIDLRTATSVGFLLAGSPWLILFSDRIWNPNFLPFFVALAIWITVRLRSVQPFERLKKNSQRLAILLISVLMLFPQIHLSSIALWPAFLILLKPIFSSWNKKTIRWIIFWIFLINLPYLTIEIKSGFTNSLAILAGDSNENWSAHFLWFPLYILRFFSLDTTYYELRGYWQQLNEWSALYGLSLSNKPLILKILTPITLLASAAIFVRLLFFSNWKFSHYTKALIASAITYFLLLALSGKHLFPHYIHALIFLAAIPFAEALQTLNRSQMRRKLVLVSSIIFCALGIWNSHWVTQEFHQTNGLKVKLATLETIFQKSSNASIGLDFNYPSTRYSYEILSQKVFKKFVAFRRYSNTDSYWLIDPKRPIPHQTHHQAVEDWDLGAVRLVKVVRE